MTDTNAVGLILGLTILGFIASRTLSWYDVHRLEEGYSNGSVVIQETFKYVRRRTPPISSLFDEDGQYSTTYSPHIQYTFTSRRGSRDRGRD